MIGVCRVSQWLTLDILHRTPYYNIRHTRPRVDLILNALKVNIWIQINYCYSTIVDACYVQMKQGIIYTQTTRRGRACSACRDFFFVKTIGKTEPFFFFFPIGAIFRWSIALQDRGEEGVLMKRMPQCSDSWSRIPTMPRRSFCRVFVGQVAFHNGRYKSRASLYCIRIYPFIYDFWADNIRCHGSYGEGRGRCEGSRVQCVHKVRLCHNPVLVRTERFV